LNRTSSMENGITPSNRENSKRTTSQVVQVICGISKRQQRRHSDAISLRQSPARRAFSRGTLPGGSICFAHTARDQRHQVPECADPVRIAMNHPELSAWSDQSRPKLSSVKKPSESIPLADAGLVSNPKERDPDLWRETLALSSCIGAPRRSRVLRRCASSPGPRHNRRSNCGFVDGHAQNDQSQRHRPSVFPGKDEAGNTATGAPWLGGNGKYDLAGSGTWNRY